MAAEKKEDAKPDNRARVIEGEVHESTAPITLDILQALVATIESRRGGDTSTSYTAQLLANRQRAFQKLGEEATEAIIAGLSEDKAALAEEAADVLYHLLVALAAAHVPFEDVLTVLAERRGVSGLREKAARKL